MKFKILEKMSIDHGISEVSFGSMRKSTRNVRKFLKSLGIKIPVNKIVWAQQVFGAKVHICELNDSGVIKEVDGLISNNPGQIIATITADCVPILLFDQKNKVVAALHGSRKSLVRGIIPNAIKKMVTRFKTKPKNILVGIGPHIRICHYWLKPKTYKSLKNSQFKKYITKSKSKIYFNLTKIVLDQLNEAGILSQNIEDCKVCTFCNYRRYFSARKQEQYSSVYTERNPAFGTFIGIRREELS